MKPINIVAIPLSVVATAGALTGLRNKYSKANLLYSRENRDRAELRLAQLVDARKAHSVRTALNFSDKRAAYKEDAYLEVEKLRKESKYYRRVHNYLQGILIIGSLAATGISGISILTPAARWAAMGVSFTVGVASGFIGYFKYRERGFYLQQTADAIETEWEAVELGIGRYKRAGTPEEALSDFVEEVHRLKVEQKKREQNLDQPPPEDRGGSTPAE